MVRENKEEKILEAAIKIFSEKGFSAATTSEIAKDAGVAEGTIFRYFKTKKDLLRGAMVKLIELIGEILITIRMNKLINEYKSMDPRAALKAIVKDRIELIEHNWDLIKVIATEVQFHEDLREAFIENVVVKGKKIIEGYLQNEIQIGVFRNINTAIVTRTLVGMLGMYIIQKKFASKVIDINDDEQIDIMIDLILSGLLNKQEVLQ